MRLDVIDWKHPLAEKSQKVVLVRVVIEQLNYTRGGLVIGSASTLYKYRVLEIQRSSSGFWIIFFFRKRRPAASSRVRKSFGVPT